MITITPLVVLHGDTPLAARLYRDTARWDEPQAIVIVTGSWLTVKEQMPHIYAEALARLGYTALTFDFSGFGASGGGLRQAELPSRKIADIVAVARFAETLSCGRRGAIGILAICASAQYALAAIARGAPVRSLASVAGWFHDAASIAPLYGGAAGIAERIAAAARAAEKFHATGELDCVPAYAPGDPVAAMGFELDYYANPRRGAIPAWKNSMATLSWFHWLAFDGLRAAADVTVPALFVHGDGCMLPENVKRLHASWRTPARLLWTEGFQVDFYDHPALVEKATAAADEHFQATLG